MSVKLILREGTLTAMLFGEIDDHTAREIRETIDSAMEKVKPKRLRLDFSGVSFMDSSGIGLIIGRYKIMKMWGGCVILCAMPAHIERLIRLSGADKLTVMERGVS